MAAVVVVVGRRVLTTLSKLRNIHASDIEQAGLTYTWTRLRLLSIVLCPSSILCLTVKQDSPTDNSALDMFDIPPPHVRSDRRPFLAMRIFVASSEGWTEGLVPVGVSSVIQQQDPRPEREVTLYPSIAISPYHLASFRAKRNQQ